MHQISMRQDVVDEETLKCFLQRQMLQTTLQQKFGQDC
jgi:hypothetical protein